MPIVSADLSLRLSGGAANADPNASIGGAKSATAVGTGLHNLFDLVSSAESTAGATEYRCIYLHNGHASLELQNAVVWISNNTPSADTSVEIGVGTSTVNGTEQSVPNETTAPAGVAFSAPAAKGTGLALGSLPSGQHRAVWIKRIVNAGAGAYNDDQVTLNFEGDTGA